jgi:hypothetical protein
MASMDFPKVTHIKKRAFLAAYSRCGSLSRAAKRAGVDRRTHYNWKKADPDYRDALLQATIEAGDALEDKLMDLAHDEGNVTAAIFLLKGLRPEKYKDRNETTFQWDGDPGKLTEPQLEKVIEWLEAMAPASAQAQPKRPALLEAGEVIDVDPIPLDEPSGSGARPRT